MTRLLGYLLGIGFAGAALASVPMTAHGPMVLFSGDFDPEPGGSGVLPTKGQFVFAFGNQKIGLVPLSIGNYALKFSTTEVSEVLALAATFDQGQTVEKGTVAFDFDLWPGQPESTFLAGVILDNPTSEFIPSTGTGDDGVFLPGVAGSGVPVQAGAKHHVRVEYTRSSTAADWSVSVVIDAPGLPPGGAPPMQSVVAGSAGRPITGIAFRKSGDFPGTFLVDNVHVVKPLTR